MRICRQLLAAGAAAFSRHSGVAFGAYAIQPPCLIAAAKRYRQRPYSAAAAFVAAFAAFRQRRATAPACRSIQFQRARQMKIFRQPARRRAGWRGMRYGKFGARVLIRRCSSAACRFRSA
jgi:hypothetical protein